MQNSETKIEDGDNKNNDPSSIPFHYIEPDLTHTPEEIERLRDDNLRCLCTRKKLHLILDLDNTLLHTRDIRTFEDQEIQALKQMDDVFEIINAARNIDIVKLRPGVVEFLNQVSSMFDLSIYTRGIRSYAQAVRQLLDDSKDGSPSMFSYVIALEDCLEAKRKGLDNVLSHERVVLIVDDNEEVWKNCGHENLIKIEPYFYYPNKKEGKSMDKELTRVLGILRKIHNAFYFDDEREQCIERDVRDVLRSVTSTSSSGLLTSLIRITKKIIGMS